MRCDPDELSFVANEALPPGKIGCALPAVVGKSDVSVEPVTNTLRDLSRAMPSPLVLVPPRKVEKIRCDPSELSLVMNAFPQKTSAFLQLGWNTPLVVGKSLEVADPVM